MPPSLSRVFHFSTGEKLPCPNANCDKTFSDRSSLSKHRKLKHGHVPHHTAEYRAARNLPAVEGDEGARRTQSKRKSRRAAPYSTSAPSSSSRQVRDPVAYDHSQPGPSVILKRESQSPPLGFSPVWAAGSSDSDSDSLCPEQQVSRSCSAVYSSAFDAASHGLNAYGSGLTGQPGAHGNAFWMAPSVGNSQPSSSASTSAFAPARSHRDFSTPHCAEPPMFYSNTVADVQQGWPICEDFSDSPLLYDIEGLSVEEMIAYGALAFDPAHAPAGGLGGMELGVPALAVSFTSPQPYSAPSPSDWQPQTSSFLSGDVVVRPPTALDGAVVPQSLGFASPSPAPSCHSDDSLGSPSVALRRHLEGMTAYGPNGTFLW